MAGNWSAAFAPIILDTKPPYKPGKGFVKIALEDMNQSAMDDGTFVGMGKVSEDYSSRVRINNESD
jgi:hypothetical protein